LKPVIGLRLTRPPGLKRRGAPTTGEKELMETEKRVLGVSWRGGENEKAELALAGEGKPFISRGDRMVRGSKREVG